MPGAGSCSSRPGPGCSVPPALSPLSIDTNSRCYGIGLSDFDGDGNVDIAFSQDNNGVLGYLSGNRDRTFDTQVDLDGGSTHTTTSMDIGDVNRDGRMDFVIGVDSGSLLFLGQ